MPWNPSVLHSPPLPHTQPHRISRLHTPVHAAYLYLHSSLSFRPDQEDADRKERKEERKGSSPCLSTTKCLLARKSLLTTTIFFSFPPSLSPHHPHPLAHSPSLARLPSRTVLIRTVHSLSKRTISLCDTYKGDRTRNHRRRGTSIRLPLQNSRTERSS